MLEQVILLRLLLMEFCGVEEIENEF